MIMWSDNNYVYRLLAVALILVCSVYLLTLDWSYSNVNKTQNHDCGDSTNSKSSDNKQYDSKYSHDKDSVAWVKKNLHKPNGKPLRLGSAGKPRARLPNGVRDWSQFAQMEEIIDKFLKHKKNGRYLEVGAHDGEFLSNSLVLERYYNWTGLLVEPNAGAFSSLLAKNRNAYALKACLANVYKQQSMKIDPYGLGIRMGEGKGKGTASIECVPLSAVFEALGWWEWNLMTIDVEGFEPEILLSIPWHLVTIDVFQIECNLCHTANSAEIEKRYFLRRFMTAVGYVEAEYFELDLIYVRKDLFEAMKLQKVNGRLRGY